MVFNDCEFAPSLVSDHPIESTITNQSSQSNVSDSSIIIENNNNSSASETQTNFKISPTFI